MQCAQDDKIIVDMTDSGNNFNNKIKATQKHECTSHKDTNDNSQILVQLHIFQPKNQQVTKKKKKFPYTIFLFTQSRTKINLKTKFNFRKKEN